MCPLGFLCLGLLLSSGNFVNVQGTFWILNYFFRTPVYRPDKARCINLPSLNSPLKACLAVRKNNLVHIWDFIKFIIFLFFMSFNLLSRTIVFSINTVVIMGLTYDYMDKNRLFFLKIKKEDNFY